MMHLKEAKLALYMLWKHVEGGRGFLAPLIPNLDVRW
jgi:hypothetical protein